MVYIYNNKFKLFQIYFLNSNSINNFPKFIENFLDIIKKKSIFKGLIIIIEKNDFNLREMKFLRGIVSIFKEKKINLGIWGLPYCVLQTILDEFEYINKYKDYLIKSNFFLDNYFKLNLNSVQILKCDICVKKNSCLGLGILPTNLNTKGYRLNFLKLSNYEKINFQDKTLKKLQKNIFNYCKNNYSEENTSRVFYYAKTHIKKNSFNYKERIIYSCKFLKLTELNKEEKFISKLSKNNEFIEYIFKIFPSELKWYIYSFAKGENKNRETFYIYFQDINKNRKIKYLEKLNIKKEMSNKTLEPPYGIGYDFIDNKFSGLKIYTHIIKIEEFLIYLKEISNFEFPKEILEIIYLKLFEKRLDNKGKLISFKIEFISSNYKKLYSLFEKEFEIKIEKTELKKTDEMIALDISLKGKINKITTYYF